MTPDRTTPRPAGSSEGLADVSAGTSRRPAGQPAGQDRRPSAGTPQGKPVANEQIPKD